MIFDFLIQTPVYILVCFLFFFVPGNLFIRQSGLKLRIIENVTLSLTLGIVIFTLGTYVFGLLHLRFLIPLVVLALAFVFFKSRKINFSFLHDLIGLFKTNMAITGVIGFGTLLFSAMVFGSGWLTEKGMQFIGVNARDSIWHLGLINGLASRFPPEHPFLSGVPLKGYHYFFDLLLGEIVNLTPISAPNLLFRFFPILISLLWGVTIYLLVLNWLEKKTAILATLWSYLGGSFSYLLFFAKRQNFSLDDSFGILQPATSMINPPFAISVVILITGFWVVYKYLKTGNNNFLITIILLFGSLVGFKVHAGMIGLGALTVTFLWKAYRSKNISYLYVIIFTILTSFFVYYPNIAGIGFLSFAPLALIQQVMASSGINWQAWELQRQLFSNNANLPKFLSLEIIGLVIFFIGNLGTRIIGFIKISGIVRKIAQKDDFSLFFFSATLISILVPLFFLQPVNPYDIVQMGWYFLLFFSVFASWGLIEFLGKIKSKFVKYFIIGILVILTFPSALEKINIYAFGAYDKRSIIVDNKTLKAISFLEKSENKNKIILELPKFLEREQSPAVIKANIAFSSIIALTGLRGYFGEEVQGYHFSQTEQKLQVITEILMPLTKKCQEEEFFKESKCREIARSSIGFIGKENIDLIYSEFKISWFSLADEIKEIYSKDGIVIYAFNEK